MTRVVLADGCFDPLHAGHIAYLEAAARLGDKLVVYVSDDSFVRAKGREPLLPWEQRRAVVGALTCVWRLAGGPDTAHTIRTWQPSVLAKGADWEDRPLPPDILSACLEVGTAVVYVDTPRQSFTALLRAWQERETRPLLDQITASLFVDVRVVEVQAHQLAAELASMSSEVITARSVLAGVVRVVPEQTYRLMEQTPSMLRATYAVPGNVLLAARSVLRADDAR